MKVIHFPSSFWFCYHLPSTTAATFFFFRIRILLSLLLLSPTKLGVHNGSASLMVMASSSSSSSSAPSLPSLSSSFFRCNDNGTKCSLSPSSLTSPSFVTTTKTKTKINSPREKEVLAMMSSVGRATDVYTISLSSSFDKINQRIGSNPFHPPKEQMTIGPYHSHRCQFQGRRKGRGRRQQRKMLVLWAKQSKQSFSDDEKSDHFNPPRGGGRGETASIADNNNNNNNNNNDVLYPNLNKKLLSLSVPLCLQQLVEGPIAALIDMIWIGKLKASSSNSWQTYKSEDILGGVGIALSAYKSVSRLYNSPLSKATASIVGRSSAITTSYDDGNRRGEQEESETLTIDNKSSSNKNYNNERHEIVLASAISSGILLAILVGMIQLICFTTFAPFILNQIMGLKKYNENSGGGGGGGNDYNDMWTIALNYMKIRAWGSPGTTLWLVMNGVFRGLGDTHTPLICSLIFNISNFVLDPVLIMKLKLGASGAALSNVISKYLSVLPLLFILQRRFSCFTRWSHRKKKKNIDDNDDDQGDDDLIKQLAKMMRQYMEASVYLVGQTAGKVFSSTYCARQSALLGPISAAAYSLTNQIGFYISIVCNSITIAVQTLLSREKGLSANKDDRKSKPSSSSSTIGDLNSRVISHVAKRSMMVGAFITTCISLVLYLARDLIFAGMSSSVAVCETAVNVLPIFILTQVLKGIAFPVNGILLGTLDWEFYMISTWVANLVCVGCFHLTRSNSGVSISTKSIWISLAAFMSTQIICGVTRFIYRHSTRKNIELTKE